MGWRICFSCWLVRFIPCVRGGGGGDGDLHGYGEGRKEGYCLFLPEASLCVCMCLGLVWSDVSMYRYGCMSLTARIGRSFLNFVRCEGVDSSCEVALDDGVFFELCRIVMESRLVFLFGVTLQMMLIRRDKDTKVRRPRREMGLVG